MDGQLDLFVKELKRQLSRLDRRIRSLALLRGLGLIVLVLVCLVALQISLDLFLALGTTARIAMSSLSVTILVACIWFAMLRRVFQKRTPVELAAIVEESQARLNERLTSVLELSSAQNESSSVLMREQLARETIASLTTFNISDSVPSDRTMRFIMSAGIAILIFLTPLLLWPDAYRLLISRSVVPWGNFATVSSLYFEVQPGDETIARGSDLQIIATPHWHTKQPGTINEVWIEWEDSKGKQFTRRMDLDQEAGHYKTQFSRLLSGFQYTISSHRSRSQRYSIQISEPASITETRLTVTPPAYTNSEQQDFAVLPSEISVLEQSGLALSLTFDRPVTEATLQYQLYTSGANAQKRSPLEQKQFVLSEDQLTAELDLPVNKQSFLFHIELLSKKGNLKTKSSEHLVKVMLDRAPEIELTLYKQAEFFKPTETLTIPVKVTDDFSVEELEIHVKKLDEKETIIKVPAEQLGTSKVDHEFKVDLQKLQAEQSDIFTYRIRTADNREVPAPNEVWSTPRVFGVDKNAEEQLSAGVISRQQELRDELKKIQQEYKEHRESVDQNIAQLKKPAEKENFKPEDEQALLQNSLTERKLAQRLETLANELLQLPLYQKLAEQAQDVARTDFVKNHDSLKAAADSKTRKQATQALKPTPAAMSATEQKLGDLAQQYEKLVDLENDLLNLNRLADETNHLADDMLAFNDKVEGTQQKPQTMEKDQKQPADEKSEPSPNAPEKPDPHKKDMSPETEQELAQLQAELKHRQSRLAKDLDNLLKRRPELVDAARNFQLKQLDSLVNQTSELVEPQKQLAEAIQQQAPVAAGKPPTSEPQEQPNPQTGSNPAPNNQAQAASAAGQAASATKPVNSQPATEAANSKPGQSKQPAERKMSPEPSQPQENKTQPESVRDLQNQQRALAEEAAQFALQTAQEFGIESEPTRKVTQLAEESIKAQQEANAGRLHEASQAANRASEVAKEIMQAHKAQNKENAERDGFLEQAEKMANQQQELSQKMEQASTSEAKRQEAVKNSQQDLARQTESLSKQLAETSNKLESDPLELNKESQQAGKAQQKTENASRAMQKAVDGLSEENLADAARQAQAAAKALQEAAQQTQKATSRKQKETPVPEKVGNQVTDAAMQLRNAQKQLEESPEFKAGNPQTAKNDPSTPRDSKPEQNQSKPTDQKPTDTNQKKSQAKSESGEKGQSSKEQAARDSKNQNQQAQSEKSSKPSASKEAAQSLKKAAESLSQAATELKSKSQKGSDSSKGQQSQTAAKNPAPGNGKGESEGGGARTSVDFTQLKTKLKAVSNRNWGELPGNLDTEILQGSRSRTDPEYARLIKHYFEAIAKSKPESK